jgi:WD40 repeat protein
MTNNNRIFNTIIFTALCCAFNAGPILSMADSISTTNASTEQKSMVPKLQDLCAQAVCQQVDWPKYFAAADGDTIKILYHDAIAIKNSQDLVSLPSDAIKRIGAAYCAKQNYDPELTRVLKGHALWVNCMLLHGDELISGSVDNTIRRWDLKTNQCLQILK